MEPTPQLPGISQPSRTGYAKIFRDSIFEPAIDGCRGSILQEQQQRAARQELPPAPRQLWEVATLPAGLTFDAVLTIGSPVASQMLLSFLRRAQEERKARLPVMVQYLVSPGGQPRGPAPCNS
jgi:hypothetical protein